MSDNDALADADNEVNETAGKLSGDHNTHDEGRSDEVKSDLEDAAKNAQDALDR